MRTRGATVEHGRAKAVYGRRATLRGMGGAWLGGALAGGAGVARAAAAAGAAAQGAQAGARWQRLPGAAAGDGPPALRDHSLAYDADRGVVYLFGGRRQGSVSGELWALDVAAGTWRPAPVADGPRPPARFGHNACYDRARQRLVVAMGQAGATFFDDVWAYDPASATWHELGARSAARPRPRYGAGGAYDAPGDRLFVTHGFTDTGRFDDTWQLDLADETWQAIPTTGHVPEARCLTRAAWHTATAGLLLFGGQSDRQSYLGDLWTLDVARGAWVERPAGASAAPSARNLYSAALDEATGVWCLFGGDTPRGPAADVWTFDPAAGRWAAVQEAAPAAGTPADAPAPRLSADMVAVPGGFVVAGGTTKAADLGDAWLLLPGEAGG
jgi:hypothetical protein